jgi:hypothetical protein
MDSAKIDEAMAAMESLAEQAHADDPSADERLRAFEDKVLGKDVPRVDGKVERGHGSKYMRMTAEHKTAHAILERLCAAEHAVTAATRAMAQAKAEHQAASMAAHGIG